MIPIIGLVTMMDGYLCPSCGLVTHQLLSPKLAMERVSQGLRSAVPDIHSANSGCKVFEPYSDRLAKMILKRQPITLKAKPCCGWFRERLANWEQELLPSSCQENPSRVLKKQVGHPELPPE